MRGSLSLEIMASRERLFIPLGLKIFRYIQILLPNKIETESGLKNQKK